MLLVEGEETTIQISALLLQDTHNDFASCILKFLDAKPVNFGIQVGASYYHTWYAAADDKVGAGRSLAEMSTGFKADIDGAAAQQMLFPDASDGIYLSMRTSAATVVALADDASVAHHHSSNHRIGCSTSFSASRQLDASPHVFKFMIHNLQFMIFLYLCLANGKF